MRIAEILMSATVVVALTVPANADPGDFLVRIRGVAVVPDVTDNIPGLTIAADGNFIPEIDGTYFLTNNIALELIAATTKHTVREAGSDQLGTVWLLPPTLTAQYHFAPQGTSFRPYVGAGINYTIMYNASDSGALAPNHLSYSDNFGWALQAGADIPIGTQGMFLNVDLKKVFLSTSVKLSGTKLGSVALDPWLIGLGIGIKL
ncbi:MAG: OmpW/AlkL family protein [Tumebacillaceae bacterium]